MNASSEREYVLRRFTDASLASPGEMTMRYAHLAPEVAYETVRLLEGPQSSG